MKKRLLHIIEEICQETGIPVEPERAAGLLLLFIAEWKKWNPKINLTAEKDEDLLIDKHIRASLQYMKGLATPAKILDIGSGGGFPGIPLKAVLPGVSMTLIESNRKRANFLRQVVRKVGLKNVDVLNLRAEDAGADHWGRYDTVMLRAVSSLEDCLQWAVPFLSPEGRVLLQKDPDVEVSEKMRTNPLLPSLVAEIPLPSPATPLSKLMVFGAGSMWNNK